MTESYKSCLVCATCQEEAVLKCKGCEVTRYCSRSCQEMSFSKHKEECSLLLAERTKREKQESLEMEHLAHACTTLVTSMGEVFDVQDVFDLGNWDKRIPYKVWRKKFTFKINNSVRESIGQKELNASDHGADAPTRSEVD